MLLGVSLYFLWQQLGWACLPGVVYMVAVVVIGTTFASKKIIPLQVRKKNYSRYSNGRSLVLHEALDRQVCLIIQLCT